MGQHKSAYLKLQKHLDQQAVGFPATRAGAELNVLRHIFTPKEAEIACCMGHKFEPLETILARANGRVKSAAELKQVLNRIQAKGGIESRIIGGKMRYCNAPLVVGMYEFQLNRLTPEFINDFDEYTGTKTFGLEFLSTKLPQLRTIPVSQSIHPRHNVSTFDEVTALLHYAEEPFVITECICRKKKSMQGKSCRATARKETCLAVGGMAEMALRIDGGREIAKEEALDIIEMNQKDGLVLQPSNTQKAEFICSCCGCCCGMLSVHKRLPKPLDFWVSNFFATVDRDTCVGCGACVRRCQVGAVNFSRKNYPAAIDLNRCIGCGVCVPACPSHSIFLEKKPTEIEPPQNREELHDAIAAAKTGSLGKLKLIGKLVVDSVRTGHFDLLK